MNWPNWPNEACGSADSQNTCFCLTARSDAGTHASFPLVRYQHLMVETISIKLSQEVWKVSRSVAHDPTPSTGLPQHPYSTPSLHVHPIKIHLRSSLRSHEGHNPFEARCKPLQHPSAISFVPRALGGCTNRCRNAMQLQALGVTRKRGEIRGRH